MERELQKTVAKIIRNQEISETDKRTEFELDEKELRRYLEIVIKEAKGKNSSNSNAFS